MDNVEVITPLQDHVETDVKIIGDKITNVQIVYLLSYIRDILQNRQTAEVKLSIGKNRTSDFFAIQVNEQDIKQVCPVEEFEIN